MLLLVLACLSCVLLAWLRCAFGAAFSSTAAYFAIKPMCAPHRPTILLNCHSDNFVRLALQDGPTAERARRGSGKMTGFGTLRALPRGRIPGLVPNGAKIASLVPALWQNGQFGTQNSGLQISRPGVSPSLGYQIAEIGRNRGTKPKVLPETARKSPRRVPNLRFCQNQGEIPPPGTKPPGFATLLFCRVPTNVYFSARVTVFGCAVPACVHLLPKKLK